MSKVELSVVILSFNTKELTLKCINSVIEKNDLKQIEVIVVDNGSNDGSVKVLEKLKEEKKIELIKNKKNLGFAGGNNVGIRRSNGKYVLLLNSDTEIENSIFKEIVRLMDEKKEVGIFGCALLNPDRSYQGNGGYFPTLRRVFSWMTIQDIPLVDLFIKPFHPKDQRSFLSRGRFFNQSHYLDWLTGAFFLIRKDVIEQIGYMDEDYFMYTEDVDYCFRAKKAGWKVYYDPKWKIIHHGGSSGTSYSYVLREFEGIKLFYKKHYPKWQYPILRMFLKIGSFWRIGVFSLIKGKEASQAYAYAFRKI